MKPSEMIVFLSCCALAMVACATPPHIVFVLTDDNGWAGVGYNNPHISTPTLDALAASGLKLTSHCTSCVDVHHEATLHLSLTEPRPAFLLCVRASFSHTANLHQMSTSTVLLLEAHSSQVVTRIS